MTATSTTTATARTGGVGMKVDLRSRVRGCRAAGKASRLVYPGFPEAVKRNGPEDAPAHLLPPRAQCGRSARRSVYAKRSAPAFARRGIHLDSIAAGNMHCGYAFDEYAF